MKKHEREDNLNHYIFSYSDEELNEFLDDKELNHLSRDEKLKICIEQLKQDEYSSWNDTKRSK